MIYLDNAANTPVDEEVLAVFSEVSRAHAANPNAAHAAGQAAGSVLHDAEARMLSLLKLEGRQLVHLSGATEANNLAIKGVARRYRNLGRHIVSTWLEHSSVNGPLAALAEEGFEVDFIPCAPDGAVDLQELGSRMRRDTILATVCAVDSEAGIAQPVEAIAEIVRRFPNARLHLDATQAIGKAAMPLACADLVSFSPHKFFGLVGFGGLVVREGTELDIQMHGGLSASPYRSGTPSPALAASTATALERVLADFDADLARVEALNRRLRAGLSRFPKVVVNSTARSVPHILSISLPGVKTEAFRAALEEAGAVVSTRSACCAPNTPSRPILALTKDRKRALSTLRISLSRLTTEREIDGFLECFAACAAD